VHTIIVYTVSMRNITLSADENLIDRARVVAGQQNRTLNDAFREWLREFTGSGSNVEQYDSLMARLGHLRAGRRFTREERNER
jgi:hypothetical protein